MAFYWVPFRQRASSADLVMKTAADRMIHRRTALSCQPSFRECALLQPKDPNTLNQEDLKKLLMNDSSTNSEETSDYYSGGYYFATCGQEIGENINYKIIRKIGFGRFSTVWMATQVTEVPGYNQYFAIKILKCGDEYITVGDQEVRLLYYVKERGPGSVGYNRIISIYDFFYRATNYGTHLCIVYEMMSCTLRDLIEKSSLHGLDKQGSQIIIAQILEGLIYLHRTCNILHADLKPENIYVVPNQLELNKMVSYVNRFNELGVQLPKSYVNTLEWYRYVEWESLPGTSTQPSDIDNLWNKNVGLKPSYHNNLLVNPNIHIKIGDLGNSCFETEKSEALIQTIHYRALEVIIDAGYSFPADMWSVGCIAYEMRTAHLLFDPYKSVRIPSTESHLCLIWQALGNIPKEVALSGNLSKSYFTPEGVLKRVDYELQVPAIIEDVLSKKFQWDFEEAILFADFIKKLLEPDCTKRWTASKVINHRWLKRGQFFF